MISVQNRFRTAAAGIPVLLLLLVSCGGRSGKAPAPEKAAARHFPSVSVPMAYDNDSVRLDYLCEHYWDGFFGGSGDTDSSLVLGVPKAELEQAFANYTAVLNMIGNPGTGDGDGMAGRLEKTDRAMLHLFSQLSARQRADSASALYTAFTQMVGSYLYDPNSPVRDEDLYLPFVREMAASDLTPDAMRTAYAYEASCCALNRRGSVAPDFRIKRADGSIFRLHSYSHSFR